MLIRGSLFLCLCILGMQQLQAASAQRIDPDTRAELEEKVVASMSLKDLERMVESDERVVNAPKPRILILPKPKNENGFADEEREAIVIERKHKFYRAPEYRYPDLDFDGIRRSSFDPDYGFERRSFRYDDDFPSFFGVADLESAGTSPVKNFYESLVDSIMSGRKFGLENDPLAALEMAASEDVPSYKPRFDYDEYSKDSTETKLQGKPYWKEAPERREEMVDENGCRTVIKKMVDPENEKKSNSENAKSVVITKECEYPTLSGPDAKIPGAQPLRFETSRFDDSTSSERDDPSSYKDSRPEELDFKKSETKDPLAPDYIDRMLESHFKHFPGFSNPITSFRGYQERFKLQAPEAFKDIKPTIGVQSYEYTHPQSGLGEKSSEVSNYARKDDKKSEIKKDSYSNGRQYDNSRESQGRDKQFEAPRDAYRSEQQYEAPRDDYRNDKQFEAPRDTYRGDIPRDVFLRERMLATAKPRFYNKQRLFEYPANQEKKVEDNVEYDDRKDAKQAKSADGKEPKMMKKSFAYYRKDNPKSDPDDHQYAEEYAQGNYRSFSSSYDSEKDGPKKQ